MLVSRFLADQVGRRDDDPEIVKRAAECCRNAGVQANCSLKEVPEDRIIALTGEVAKARREFLPHHKRL